MTRFAKYVEALDALDTTPEGWAIDLQLDLAKLILQGLQSKLPIWKQRQLATLSGLSDAKISALIHGEENCKILTLCKALHPLGPDFQPALVSRASLRTRAIEPADTAAYLNEGNPFPLTGTDDHGWHITKAIPSERVIPIKGSSNVSGGKADYQSDRPIGPADRVGRQHASQAPRGRAG